MRLAACAAVFIYITFVVSGRSEALTEISVIAHMVNTNSAIQWSLDEGANGVELDLNFDKNGNPSKFRHAKICDCACMCPESCNGNVCAALLADTGEHCLASTSAEDLTTYLGTTPIRSKLSIIHIDSKFYDRVNNFTRAGELTVELLNRNVLSKGYTGQLIISAPNVKFVKYLRGALAAAKNSLYFNQYFYSFVKQVKGNYKGLMSLQTKNIVFVNGQSRCGPAQSNFNSGIEDAKLKNKYAGIAAWTIDDKKTMSEYAGHGANIFITNYPSLGVDVFGKGNLAKPGDALRPIGKPIESDVTARPANTRFKKLNRK